MPAAFFGVGLTGVRQGVIACCARSPASLYKRSVHSAVSIANSRPFTTPGAQSLSHQTLSQSNFRESKRLAGSGSRDKRRFSISQEMTTNGDARSKRKSSPIKVLDRPSKAIKHDSYSDNMEEDRSPEEGVYNMDTNGEDHIPLQPLANMVNSAEWQETIEKVVRNVVSIRFCQTCSFDTDSAVSSEATGFVVDAEKGYILTNRHVVGAGPFWGFCIFDNHEEVGQTQATMPSSDADRRYPVRCVPCLPRPGPRLRHPSLRS